MASTKKTKGKSTRQSAKPPKSVKAPRAKAKGRTKAAARVKSTSANTKPAPRSAKAKAKAKVVAKPKPKHKPKPITIKSKSGRKPLTIKEPARKAGAATANSKADAKAGKGSKKPLTDAEKNSLLKSKKTRTVAEAASEIKADAKGYVFINGRRVRMISTKGHPPIKKVRPVTPTQSAAEASAAAAAVRAIKTKLTRKELNVYRDLLLAKRRQLVGDLTAMEDQALRSGGGNLSHMPIHMADVGTDTFDQDFTLKLAEAERQQLREIDAALQRIADSTYGVCQMTGKPIPKARLEAKPWAKYTIEAARIIESQWGR